MDISPQTIRSTGFKTVKKGYDPAEVESFKDQVSSVVENAQNQAAAMEARARAAVAKLQEVSQQVAGGARDTAAPSSSDDAEVISRTLLLAQRAADSAVTDARAEADSITAHAREEASRVLDGARSMAAKTVEESRVEARRAMEDDRVKAENEVQSLLARRDFLLADVDHLEHYLQAQRERLRDAAVQLQELVDRVPGGLGDMRRPLLSASAEPLSSSLQPLSSGASSGASSSGPSAGEHQAITPDIFESEPEPAPDYSASDESFAGADDDAGPLFTERSSDLTAMALSASQDAHESVWRLLDEEVASTQAAQASLHLDDDTDEVDVPPSPATDHDPFRVAGDELQ